MLHLLTMYGYTETVREKGSMYCLFKMPPGRVFSFVSSCLHLSENRRAFLSFLIFLTQASTSNVLSFQRPMNPSAAYDPVWVPIGGNPIMSNNKLDFVNSRI